MAWWIAAGSFTLLALAIFAVLVAAGGVVFLWFRFFVWSPLVMAMEHPWRRFTLGLLLLTLVGAGLAAFPIANQFQWLPGLVLEMTSSSALLGRGR